jgi:hypothetical protein
MRTREQQITLAACVAVHGLLLAWLFATMVSVGKGPPSSNSGTRIYLTLLPDSGAAQPKPATKTPPPPKLPPITETALPPVPQEDLLKLVQLPTVEADAPSSAPAAPAGGGYDDPYAGAAINDLRGIHAATPALPPAPPIPPPQLDSKRWQAFTNTLKRSASGARSLALLVQIDTQGRVIDCQIIGGDAQPDLQRRSCTTLKGQKLFAFETPPSEAQWRSLPQILF